MWSWAEGLKLILVTLDTEDEQGDPAGAVPVWCTPDGRYRLFGQDFDQPLEAVLWATAPRLVGTHWLTRTYWGTDTCTWDFDSRGFFDDILESSDGQFLNENGPDGEHHPSLEATVKAAVKANIEDLQERLCQVFSCYIEALQPSPQEDREVHQITVQPPIPWVVGFEGIVKDSLLAWGAAAIYLEGELVNGVTHERVAQLHEVPGFPPLRVNGVSQVPPEDVLKSFGVQDVVTPVPAHAINPLTPGVPVRLFRVDLQLRTRLPLRLTDQVSYQGQDSWRSSGYQYYLIAGDQELEAALKNIEAGMTRLAAKAIEAGLTAVHDSPQLHFARAALKGADKDEWLLASILAKEPLAGLVEWAREVK